MVDWHLGTVGFSYKDWDGVFYPAKMPARSYLAHYSTIFNGVELDSTFYGTPPISRVKQWAVTAPENFKFCVKTPRQITHDARLLNVAKDMRDFVTTMALLEEKLGAILIQLPPTFSAAEHDTVVAFLSALPSGFDYAIEFRHQSWFTPETAVMLEKLGVCWVSADYIDLPKQVAPITDFFYIRWLGRHGQFKKKDREQIDIVPQLEWWWQYIQPHLAHVKTIYGFFNNDYSGHSPRTCNRFKEMVGEPINTPNLPQQGRLF